MSYLLPICSTCGREIRLVYATGGLFYPIHIGSIWPEGCPPVRETPTESRNHEPV